MKTDFSSLTRFESALIVMIVLGLAIVGFEIYSSVPLSSQTAVSESLAVFDVSETISITFVGVSEILQIMNEVQTMFADELAKAVAIPDELSVLADHAGFAIQKNLALIKMPSSDSTLASGLVLGETTSKLVGCGSEEVAIADTVEVSSQEKYFSSYEVPNFSYLTQYVPLLNN